MERKKGNIILVLYDFKLIRIIKKKDRENNKKEEEEKERNKERRKYVCAFCF